MSRSLGSTPAAQRKLLAYIQPREISCTIPNQCTVSVGTFLLDATLFQTPRLQQRPIRIRSCDASCPRPFPRELVQTQTPRLRLTPRPDRLCLAQPPSPVIPSTLGQH